MPCTPSVRPRPTARRRLDAQQAPSSAAPPPQRWRLLAGGLRRRHLQLRERGVPRLPRRPAAQQAHRRHGGDARRRRLLAGGLRRRHLQLRGRGVLRVPRRPAAQQAHRRHGGDARRWRLLAGGLRRRHLQLRRRDVLRVPRRPAPQQADRRHGVRPRRRRLLAGGVRRRDLQLRRCCLLGLDRRHRVEPSRSSASRDSDGGGYWLVASDGGIFNFGDAVFSGRPRPTGSAMAWPDRTARHSVRRVGCRARVLMWGLFVGAAAAALAPAGPGALVPLKMAIASADSVGNDVYVAVVVDFGNGSSMSTVSKCVPVASNGQGRRCARRCRRSDNVAYASSGLLCAIDNYPANGVQNCGESVGSATTTTGRTGTGPRAPGSTPTTVLESSRCPARPTTWRLEVPAERAGQLRQPATRTSRRPTRRSAMHRQRCRRPRDRLRRRRRPRPRRAGCAGGAVGDADDRQDEYGRRRPAHPRRRGEYEVDVGQRTRHHDDDGSGNHDDHAGPWWVGWDQWDREPRIVRRPSFGRRQRASSRGSSGGGSSSNLLPVVLVAVIVAALGGFALFRWRRRPAEE